VYRAAIVQQASYGTETNVFCSLIVLTTKERDDESEQNILDVQKEKVRG